MLCSLEMKMNFVVLLKEELCEVLEVRMVSDRVMAIVFVFEEYVLSLFCGYSVQSSTRLKKSLCYE